MRAVRKFSAPDSAPAFGRRSGRVGSPSPCFGRLWLILLLLPARAFAGESALSFNGAAPLEWSQRLARSEMARRGSTLNYQGAPRARWDYTTGLFSFALLQLAARTGDAAMTDYGAKLVESFVQPDGSIATYRRDEFNLDMITPGRALQLRFEQTGDPRLKTALTTLRGQLADQPRTSEGGFWHKQRYPHQMWLDGLYMASPFLAHAAKLGAEPAAFDDVARQLVLADRHTFDPATGLFYHAWDEKRAQAWADPRSGHSPSFWGRSVGWYAMALVDCLDDLPPTHPEVEATNEILRRAAAGLARHQDPASGLWWQVLDQGGKPGNYLEASASSMFVYALAKGINRGYLPREQYLPVVTKAYAGLVRECVRLGADGQVNLTHICEVAGLGYTSASGRARDGSYAYYVSEPVVENDLKGVAAFILAGLEVQTLLTAPAAPAVVRGWADLDRVLARIKAPVFPARDFPITDFGARTGADTTTAIRAAIEACHAAGGGRVIVPAGDWLTGAIQLQGGVNLHVAAGATLRFVTDPAAYPIVFTRWEGIECLNYSSLIYAFEQTDVAVTGEGKLDGQADWSTWWAWNNKDQSPVRQRAARNRLVDLGERGVPVAERRFGDGGFLRPNFIQFYRCENVLVEGVTLVRSPMWEIHPVLSRNVIVRGVKIDTHGPNNDGCDPESSRDVLIEDCVFSTGDDCIAIKSGRGNDGRRVNAPSENLVIRRCQMRNGHGGVVLGSEVSGDVRNVFVEDCIMDSPDLDRALRLKSNAQRGGVLENVFMRNVRIGQVSEAVVTVDLLYEEGAAGPYRPVVRNIQLDHVTSTASPRVLYIQGFPGALIDNFRLTDCAFSGVREAEVVSGAGTVIFNRVTITPARPVPSRNSAAPPAK